MAHLDVMLLGRFEARLDGERIDGLSYDKVRALLAYLAVESDRLHPRESIAGLLWAEYPEQRARQNLSQALLTLRKAINDDAADPPFLHITRYALQFNRECDHTVDVTAFLSLLEAVDRHKHATLAGCTACLGRLAEATKIYRGEFLATFSLPDSPDFEEWALLERERLGRKAVMALDQLATSHLSRGEVDKALEHARHQVMLDPWQERAHRLVMRALARLGQRHAAREQYERCRSALEADLGVAPEPETTALYEQIRSGALTADGSLPLHRPGSAQAQKRSRAGVISPDTTVPDSVPLKQPLAQQPGLTGNPEENKHRPPHNLPAQLARFIGRNKELEILNQIFRDPGNRLISLVGPGGSGKTRLVIEAARQCIDQFDDGVYLVALAAPQTPEAISPTIAETIGLQLHPGESPKTRLADYLRSKTVLLILDNFEHVLRGLDIVVELLNAAPKLRVAITSRARTNAQSEVLFMVEGMALPDPETDLSPDRPSDAMALFVEGAQRNDPGFTLNANNVTDIWRICAAVSGVPLAVLLAASWVPLLSPNEIAERLGSEYAANADFLRADWQDVPRRQRSLRTVFDHAWQLLTIREKAVFEALSIFRGGFTRVAAKNVVGATLWELRSLVNKSFVNILHGGRYEIHELMRQYAAEKLEGTPVAWNEVCSQHGHHYLAQMTRWSQELQNGKQQHALDEIAAETENARIAWFWLLENHALADLSPALQACCLFYDWRVRYEEGRSFCKITVEMTETDGPDISDDGGLRSDRVGSAPLRARAMAWLGRFEHYLGNTAAAEAWLQRALDLVRTVDTPSQPLLATHAFVLEQLGTIAAVHSRDTALDLYRAALMRYQEAGDTWGTANAYYDLGTIGHQTSRYMQSQKWYEESLALRRRLGDRRGIADALIWLGWNAVRLGNADEGVLLIREGADIRRSTGDRPGLALATFHLGQAHLWTGEFDRSHRLIGESIALFEGLGERYHTTYANVFLGSVEGFMGDYDHAWDRLERGLELALAGGFKRECAFARLCLSSVALAQGQMEQGLSLANASVTGYRELDQRDELAWALGARALILNRLGRQSEAWDDLNKSLQISVALRSFGVVLWGLPVMAVLTCDSGDILQAVEICTVLRRYPMVAKSVWHEEVIGRHIRAAAEALPKDSYADAQERGRTTTLQDLIAEVRHVGSVRAQ